MKRILIKKEYCKELKNEVLSKENLGNFGKDLFHSCKVKMGNKQITFVNVYNYISPYSTKRELEDFEKFKRELLSYIERNNIVIFGGDLNMDVRFIKKENWESQKWGKCIKDLKTKLKNVGYCDVLQEIEKNFTYFTINGKGAYQLDYLFVPKKLKILNVEIGNKKEIFEKPRLSDHLPVVATLEI